MTLATAAGATGANRANGAAVAAVAAAAAAAAAPTAPRLDIAGERATITLNDAAAHNRITPAHLDVLGRHLDRVASDASIRVLILTGSGEKTFCSGYDASSLQGGLDQRWEALLDRLEALAVPTLCAVNGNAFGGGIDLALCCDLRIGVTGSRMTMPTSRLGIHLYPGGMRRFARSFGIDMTKRLLMTALPLEGEDMVRCGFLCEAVERPALADAVQRYASAIAACEPKVLITTKGFLNKPLWTDQDLAAMRDAHQCSIAAAGGSGRLSNLKKN